MHACSGRVADPPGLRLTSSPAATLAAPCWAGWAAGRRKLSTSLSMNSVTLSFLLLGSEAVAAQPPPAGAAAEPGAVATAAAAGGCWCCCTGDTTLPAGRAAGSAARVAAAAAMPATSRAAGTATE